jgi:hypothetical protein
LKFGLSILLFLSKIPFPAVTICSDLKSHNKVFDYNRIVKALQFNEMTIDNVTSEELVNYSAWLRGLLHEFGFRLKYMQAVALVTGDEFLVQYNLTIDSSDVYDYMSELRFNWHKFDHAYIASFDNYYGVDFAEIFGPTGFCYNFNMPEADDFFHLKT